MSLAENLLNSLDETAYQNMRIAGGVPEEHIKVGQDRVITVPNALKTIAVKGDKDVETATVDCVRYWDGNDLSTFAIYLNYILPNGDEGTYIPESIIKSENTFSFDWQIGSEFTYAQGTLTFWIVAKSTDDNGTLIKQWSSFQNHDCTIAQGGDKIYVPEKQTDQDVISQVLAVSRSSAEIAQKQAELAKESADALKMATEIFIMPQMFGAKGDGVTDDTEAFKECFKHTNIYIPFGTYILTETIDVLSKTNIVGNTREGTIIQSTADIVLNAQGFVDVSNLRITGNKTNTGIQFPQHNLRLVNVDFRDLNIGVISNGETTVKFNSLERCSFWGVKYPLHFNSATAQFNTTMILNCTFREYVCVLTAPFAYSVKFDSCAFLGEKTDTYILDVESNTNTIFQSCYIETFGELVSERWAHGNITVKNTWIYTKHPFFHARESRYYRTAKFVESTIINSDSDEETFPMLIDGTNLTVDLVECLTSLGAKNASHLTITTADIAEQYGIATNCRINNGYLTLDTLPIYNGEVE